MPDLSRLIGHWGYPAIFVVVVLGNIGLPVPEETVLIVAGYLVWHGQLWLSAVLTVGVVSAVVGDNIGYWLGRRYGRTVVDRSARWAAVPPERLQSMQRLVSRYGPLGVFFGRFLPGLRFMAGPLAGATGVRFRPFFVANLLGALVFVPYGVGLGYALGYGLDAYVARIRYAEHLLLVSVLAGAIGLAGCRVIRLIWRRRKSRHG